MNESRLVAPAAYTHETKTDDDRQRLKTRVGRRAAAVAMSLTAVLPASACSTDTRPQSSGEATPAITELKNNLTDVEELEQRGGCPDELHAQAEHYRFLEQGQYGSVATQRDQRRKTHLYEAAAALAESHDIDCEPSDSNAQTLTPDFDTTQLRRDNTCAAELLARREDPEEARTVRERKQTEIDNHALKLQAELAESRDIDCR